MEVIYCSYAKDESLIHAIRRAVFVDEQSVPEEIETDDRDPHCFHVLALDGSTPAGTGRIDLDKGGKIGRVAVLPGYRRQGVGSLIMQALEGIAVSQGRTEVWCHAQESAYAFYERLGYRAEGESFTEAGIVHRKMRRDF